MVEEKAALSHLREVEAGRRDAADADADNVAAAEEAAPALPLWKLRTRLATVEATPKPKVATPSANMLPPPPHERRPSRSPRPGAVLLDAHERGDRGGHLRCDGRAAASLP